MDKYQRKLKAIDMKAREVVAEARAITEAAEAEGRSLTDEEGARVDTLLKSITTLKEQKAEVEAAVAVRDEVDSVGSSIIVEKGDTKSAVPAARRALSIGEAFVKSDGYRTMRARGLSGQWSTGSVDLEGKALLDSGAVGSDENGLLQADVQPGILPVLFQKLTIADLLAQGTTAASHVRYMVETTATSGAAGVPESGSKPESSLAFDAVDEPVKKIATFLPVTDEMIEDVPALTSYINGRLSLFVKREEEDQLLNGSGGDDLIGILDRVPGGNQGVTSNAVDAQILDHIYAGITQVRLSFLEPDAVVMHPEDYATIQTLKDGVDRYLGAGAYGPAQDVVWGKRVVVTTAIAQGTALVGAFQESAQIFRRGGLTVEASNSHADFFQHNKTAIRAEERMALAVYRPEGFATVTLGS